MPFKLSVIIVFSLLAAYAFSQTLYLSGMITLACAFGTVFIIETINVPEIRNWVERVF